MDENLFTYSFWGQLSVVYYDLQKPNENITGDCYRLTTSNKFEISSKRPEYEQIFNKAILQNDNDRPHVAMSVTNYFETPKWNILPHPPYSPDTSFSLPLVSITDSNKKFPSYKSDDISVNDESKADQLENYDTNVERLPDWLTESFHATSGVLRKKSLEEFLPFSDNIPKRFSSRNSRDSPDESFEESHSSFKSYLLNSDEDNENELLTKGNRKDSTDDYVLDSQSTTTIYWTETLLLKHKEEALRNENSKLHAKLEGISQWNKKLQHELEKLKSSASEM
ncbi:mariner Mos1 transposase [Trichonephila inaurata madagascariensis]|uniref:Mariner Mos1 transposase n=1 Tax=Trichonephila inaurata madagascariensis TaxID=2747483 RepID=A0A8X7BTF6_9ARAC|nr:mariner Mos1 transposase [Trichonephila inaurata madagascariensis]